MTNATWFNTDTMFIHVSLESTGKRENDKEKEGQRTIRTVHIVWFSYGSCDPKQYAGHFIAFMSPISVHVALWTPYFVLSTQLLPSILCSQTYISLAFFPLTFFSFHFFHPSFCFHKEISIESATMRHFPFDFQVMHINEKYLFIFITLFEEFVKWFLWRFASKGDEC